MTIPKDRLRPVHAWFERTAWDWLLVTGTVALAALISLGAGAYGTQEVAPDTRRALYQTVTTITGTLLGLTLTSVSILNTALQRETSTLTPWTGASPMRGTIASMFFGSVRALGIGVVVGLVALVGDSEAKTGSPWTQIALTAAMVLVTARVTRMLWALSLIVKAPVPSTPARPRPPVTDEEY